MLHRVYVVVRPGGRVPGVWSRSARTDCQEECTRHGIHMETEGGSGVVLLNVGLRLGSAGDSDETLLEAVIPHTHRFLQPSVRPNFHFVLPLDASMPFTEPAPLLERLTICNPLGNWPAILFHDPPQHPTIPLHLLRKLFL